ncbi:MAG: hypothetical protein NZ920_02270 [Aigarchaeota archaeon]|nr:hypothetical protein [Aigarchaeota archaeon]MDW8092549.1 hypothetical protein [Nitrososphaerota archaeon]
MSDSPYLISFIVLTSLPLTILMTGAFNRLSFRFKLLGRDVHKPTMPLVPSVGGLGFVCSYLFVTALSLSFLGASAGVVVFVLVPLIAALIGLVEDLRELNPVLKPFLLVIPGVVVLVLGLYDPFPIIPFIGQVRLTIVYPLILLLAYPVVCNAVNSLDVLNGSLILTSVPVLSVLGALSYLNGSLDSAIAAVTLSLGLLGFARFNLYPARSFSGNAGSLMIGAVITSVAIYSKLEVVALTALLPHIMNEFHLLSSIGGLKSGKSYRRRPVEVANGMIRASVEPSAPLTLVRMLTLSAPQGEARLVLRLGLISTTSSVLAVMTHVLGGL